MMEDYNNTLHFEMLTMLEMAKQEILPACLKYTKFVTDDIASKKALGLNAPKELEKAQRLTELTEDLMIKIDTLDAATDVPDVDVYQWVCIIRILFFLLWTHFVKQPILLKQSLQKNTGRSQHTQIYFILYNLKKLLSLL